VSFVKGNEYCCATATSNATLDLKRVLMRYATAINNATLDLERVLMRCATATNNATLDLEKYTLGRFAYLTVLDQDDWVVS